MNGDRRSMRLVTRIGIAVMVALALMVPLAASAHTNVSNGNLKNFQHVFVIMMEKLPACLRYHDGEHELHEPDWQ